MITVRYPTGHTVCYEQANYVLHYENKFHLQTKKDGSTVALIPYASGATVEFYHPCNIKTEFNTLDDALQYVVNNAYDSTTSTWNKPFRLLKRLKNLLNSFDARSGVWK